MVVASSLVNPLVAIASVGTFAAEALLAFALAVLTSLVDPTSLATPSSAKEQAATSTLAVVRMNRSRHLQGFIRCHLDFA